MITRRFKALCVAISLTAALCGCSGADKTDSAAAEELNSAVSAVNAEASASGDYLLEITFGAGSVLYYAKGNIEFDRSEKKAFADFKQTWLGTADEVQNYYSNGIMLSVCDGESLSGDRDADELFSKFPYSKLLPCEDGRSVTVGGNSLGKTFSVTRSDTEKICETVVGDIYSLVTVIKKPQKDKTKYGDTTVTYTVSDGKAVACRYEFGVTLFDTPSYVPGYQPPESEYTVELKVSAKVTYSDFGVEVREYPSEPEE